MMRPSIVEQVRALPIVFGVLASPLAAQDSWRAKATSTKPPVKRRAFLRWEGLPLVLLSWTSSPGPPGRKRPFLKPLAAGSASRPGH